ncbi:hypothetical protein BACT_0607 [Bifidobacterium actinocoloniiforme DSM 22766]|uniref:Uncharacterized protein n=1 Tax=Bifidobacterium actinocoloniiforme DSM 22766 TaxID=1437605 RepID=A0A086Z056_9BIFI|nr:hypothetical protein BACT_0607 [Bifidobacterium actinocoloniiforme DSM 22766]
MFHLMIRQTTRMMQPGRISSRKMLKLLKRSLKYYSRSNTELSKALKKASDKTSRV